MTGQKVKCKKATVVTKETKEQQQTGQVSMDIGHTGKNTKT